uniref:Uncharacterized protein n=1 Tax=Anopheles arabiensis TaxID=7173 RepID=A0A182IGU6_ANOAR
MEEMHKECIGHCDSGTLNCSYDELQCIFLEELREFPVH